MQQASPPCIPGLVLWGPYLQHYRLQVPVHAFQPCDLVSWRACLTHHAVRYAVSFQRPGRTMKALTADFHVDINTSSESHASPPLGPPLVSFRMHRGPERRQNKRSRSEHIRGLYIVSEHNWQHNRTFSWGRHQPGSAFSVSHCTLNLHAGLSS